MQIMKIYNHLPLFYDGFVFGFVIMGRGAEVKTSDEKVCSLYGL